MGNQIKKLKEAARRNKPGRKRPVPRKIPEGEYRIGDVEHFREFFSEFAHQLAPGDVLLLEGVVGAGKTEAVRTVVESLGGRWASSPSYTVHQRYAVRNGFIDHVDLYRLEDDADLESTGFWDLFDSKDSIIAVEWADRLTGDVWPVDRKLWRISIGKLPDDSRTLKLNFKSNSEQILKPGFSVGGYFEKFVPPGTGGSLSRDERLMQTALELSMEACGISAPNPAVGCVVYRGGKPVARGRTQAYRREHAERMALRGFKSTAEDCDLYVTLEPCANQGHQPPCIELVEKFRWRRAVVAVSDPNPKTAGRSLARLGAGEVLTGVLRNECIAWNLPFFFQQKAGRPLIAGKWAETKSGLLADKDGRSKWISNELSRKHTHWLRRKYDAILVGAGTVINDKPLLNVRLENTDHQPLRIFWDPKDRLRDFAWLKDERYLATGQKTLILRDPDLARHLATPEFAREAGELLGRPLQSVLVEGGARTLAHLAERSMLDLVHVFRSEKDFEGESPHRRPFNPNEGWKILADVAIGDDRLIEAMPPEKFATVFQGPE